MPVVELSAGHVEYTDTGGDGPTLVFLHGLVMDGTLFDPVVEELRADHRCVAPTLPLGGHRLAMRADADLSLRGFGRLVGEFLERLDLDDVTLVQSDHAAALVYAGDGAARVARLVVSSCEAFDNYPPGLPGRNASLLARIPGGIYAALQLMRIRPLRRLPMTLGWMAKRPVPAAVADRWFAPAQSDRAIRRDLIKYAAHARAADMLDVTERLRTFDRPALVLWASEDRVMPPDHGRRLAELLPHARLIYVDDSYTLIPLDQPIEFARHIREFVATAPPERERDVHPRSPGATRA